MQKPRVNVHVTEEVWRRLDKFAGRPNVSKAAIVDAALAAFLSPEADDKRDAAIIRRLDKLDRRLEKLEEQNVVISETLAIIAHICLYFAPIIPEAEKDAAVALGEKRYQKFLNALGNRLAAGTSLKDLAIEAAMQDA